MKKYMWRIVIPMALSLIFLFGCSPKEYNETSKKTSEDRVDVIEGEHAEVPQTSKNMNAVENQASPDEASKELDGSNKTDVIERDANSNYDVDFHLVIEAEDAAFTGKVREENRKSGYTGAGYLTGIETEEDTTTFHVTVPGAGAYDLNFRSVGNTGYKENNIYIDGEFVGVAKVDGDEFTDSIVKNVYLNEGEHDITLKKGWGWILLDHLEVTASGPADKSIYTVSTELVDPKATAGAKRLMQYLADMYGKYIISGQYGNRGIDGSEFKAIYQASGKYPAMMGLDFIEYTPSRVAFGSQGKDVDYAIQFHRQGGIVTFCWHWNAPEPYLYNTNEQPWWSGFYTRAANINLKKIMDGDDPEGYDLLIRDIDVIAEQLQRLQEADIPILWRPLHEASGGWFWWGASGPEAYIELYQLLYDRLTDYHNIHNLIWVWNGQNKDWYPGDEFVDIAGIDIYPGEHVYSSQGSGFNELVEWNGDNHKIIALTENGCMFDPDLAFRDNAIWSYFGTWGGEFITLNNTDTLSEKYTETDMLVKVYTSEKVITLDELPDLETYGE